MHFFTDIQDESNESNFLAIMGRYAAWRPIGTTQGPQALDNARSEEAESDYPTQREASRSPARAEFFMAVNLL